MVSNPVIPVGKQMSDSKCQGSMVWVLMPYLESVFKNISKNSF